jgi:alanine dehydrogenase
MVKALSHDHHLRNGLSVHRGQLTSEPVAKAQRVDFVLAEELLAA